MAPLWYVGQTVAAGRYRIVSRLGQGTFGEVYLADRLLGGHGVGGQAVLKVLHPQWIQVPQVVERFRRESEIGQRIDHPHVARVFEYGQLEGGVPFIAMEYLQGRTLRHALAQGPLPPGRAFALMAAVADALATAHRAGVVHRDLKPENIMLVQRGAEQDVPMVLDFGIAKLLDAADRLTATGAVLGTPVYMSPEQFRGETNIGPAADVYALGVLAFEVCTGKPPFAGYSFAELALAHMGQPAPPLTGVPGEVAHIVACCLDKTPARRPEAHAVARVLRTVAQRSPLPPSGLLDTVIMNPLEAATVVGGVSLARRTWVGPGNARFILLSLALALLLVGLALVGYFAFRS
ncbi:MAG: serine/threonine-protein kinase [Myxococcales bacterium]|nr:serine/threonine protein kinase [Myxococcota bacterium]MDW8281706.1 serine/threonine-protein kinase [Myxococcales bacterium]